MPQPVGHPGDLTPGDLFEDCRFHPCLCIEVGDENDPAAVWGISLVDGSASGCDVRHCGLRKLTLDEAVQWKHGGPSDRELEGKNRWW